MDNLEPLNYTIVYALLKKKIEAVQKEIDDMGDVLSWMGVTTTVLSDGSTANPISINGTDVTAVDGNVAAYNGIEYVFNGTTWQEFGRDVSTLVTKADISYNGILKGDGSGGVSAAVSGTDYAEPSAVTASASIGNTGLVSFKNGSGTSLYTLQLPIYNGGVN